MQRQKRLSYRINHHEAKLRRVLFGAALLPALHLLWRWQNQDLGINPFATLSHTLGHVALVFLLITLAITPLRRGLRLLCATLKLEDGKRLADWNFLIRARRQLGLHGFFYASLHALTYLQLEVLWDWHYLKDELTQKPYLALGLAAWVITFLLAITSPKVVIRHLHHWWRRLHRLMYLLIILAIAHYWGAAKVGNPWPLICALIAALLLVQRIWTALASHHHDTPSYRERRTEPVPPVE